MADQSMVWQKAREALGTDRPALPGDRSVQASGDPSVIGESRTSQAPSLSELFQEQLKIATEQQASGLKRQQAVQGYAPEVQKNIDSVRDLSQRVSGEAPSARLLASQGLGESFVGAASDVAKQASGDNVLKLLGLLQQEEQRKIENRAKDIERGFKINDDGTIDPLTEEEQAQRGLKGEEAVAQVMKDGGSDFIRKGGSKDERYAIAESILQAGGVAEYRKQVPLIEILDAKEEADAKVQTDLLQLIDQGIDVFSSQDMPTAGTGPLAQFIPGFAAGEKTRNLRRTAESIRSQYAKILSGATISDKEIERLAKFLPSSAKTEQQNLEDMKKLSKEIMINQEIFEKGKREGLTPNEAYKKYGAEIFKKWGVGEDESGKKQSSGFTIEAVE